MACSSASVARAVSDSGSWKPYGETASNTEAPPIAAAIATSAAASAIRPRHM